MRSSVSLPVGGAYEQRYFLTAAKPRYVRGNRLAIALEGYRATGVDIFYMHARGAGSEDNGQITRAADTKGFFGEKARYKANSTTAPAST